VFSYKIDKKSIIKCVSSSSFCILINEILSQILPLKEVLNKKIQFL